MYLVSKDMRDLKEKANVERIKAKSQARLVHAEKERDWFRKEALQLDQINKENKIVMIEMKVHLENVNDDKDFMQKQLI